MRDVTNAILQSQDYTTVGCANEANGDDGLCRYCRMIPSRQGGIGVGTPLVPPSSSPPEPWTDDEPEEEAVPEPRPCRKNCGRPATKHIGGSGPYANLCDECTEEMRANQRAHATRQGQRKPTRPAGEKTGESTSRISPTTGLADLAQEVDALNEQIAELERRRDEALERARDWIQARLAA